MQQVQQVKRPGGAFSTAVLLAAATLAVLLQEPMGASRRLCEDATVACLAAAAAAPLFADWPAHATNTHLYGTWLWPSTSAVMTLASASRPLLMLMASLRRAPSAPVRLARSEPARSTRCI